jgi:hypothetical protein
MQWLREWLMTMVLHSLTKASGAGTFSCRSWGKLIRYQRKFSGSNIRILPTYRRSRYAATAPMAPALMPRWSWPLTTFSPTAQNRCRALSSISKTASRGYCPKTRYAAVVSHYVSTVVPCDVLFPTVYRSSSVSCHGYSMFTQV